VVHDLASLVATKVAAWSLQRRIDSKGSLSCQAEWSVSGPNRSLGFSLVSRYARTALASDGDNAGRALERGTKKGSGIALVKPKQPRVYNDQPARARLEGSYEALLSLWRSAQFHGLQQLE